MSTRLMEYFNKRPRLGCLATANAKGEVDVAYFGSPQMIDEKRIVMGLGDNRTLRNLRENPHAAFMIMEPGASMPEWHGVRLYVTMIACEASGGSLDMIRAAVARGAGERAAKSIQAAATFEIGEIRPLADFGQGWEKSIG
ncbi:MAG: pyridoxamine 5'-phosphate oxidase family protein [Candidatus Polarisedimenticolia bacterium]